MKNKILIPFEKIEELIDGKKFFSVNRIVEQIDYVFAHNEEEAKELVSDEIEFVPDEYNTDVTVTEIKHSSSIDYCSLDEYPVGISITSDIRNIDIFKFFKEIERREKIKKELDEKQLKFNI